MRFNECLYLHNVQAKMTGIRPYKYYLCTSFFTFLLSNTLPSHSFDHFLCLINFFLTIIYLHFFPFDFDSEIDSEIDILDKNAPESYMQGTTKTRSTQTRQKEKEKRNQNKKGGSKNEKGTGRRFSVLSLLFTVTVRVLYFCVCLRAMPSACMFFILLRFNQL